MATWGCFIMSFTTFSWRFRVCDKKSVAQSESVENCWETLVCSSKKYIIIYIYLFSKYDCHWNIPIRTWLDTWMCFRICRYIWIDMYIYIYIYTYIYIFTYIYIYIYIYIERERCVYVFRRFLKEAIYGGHSEPTMDADTKQAAALLRNSCNSIDPSFGWGESNMVLQMWETWCFDWKKLYILWK